VGGGAAAAALRGWQGPVAMVLASARAGEGEERGRVKEQAVAACSRREAPTRTSGGGEGAWRPRGARRLSTVGHDTEI
jgi:hypothetical protein